MKISYRTHPIIKWVEDGYISNLGIFESDRYLLENDAVLKNIDTVFGNLSKRMSGKYPYKISQNFIEAFEQCGDKLMASNLFSSVEDGCAIFLFPNSISESTIIDVKNDTINKVITCAFQGFANRNVFAYSGIYVLDYKNDADIQRTAYALWSKNLKNGEEHIFNVILLMLFIKYAQVETKFLPSGKKIKGIDCDYTNETKLNINYIDSKWFTTLVKSDGFKVRGHFRLQPKKKDGEWTKELIWITDFEKTGYTAPARKL